ncbi:MAG: [protein-PII] uridylyltransferase [Myxococcota bacterium]|nr:[protein-PII] uridylyltransferase [Myxococcota bacterium]
MSTSPSIDSYLAPFGLPPASPPSPEGVPAAVREYLAAARQHLEHLHRSGASGQQLNETHSDLMDRLVRRLFEIAEELFFARGGEEQADLCVLAVGGYARREMDLHSDVDLLFLYREEVSPHVRSVSERVQLWLWDAQLAVGAATRTIDETIGLADEDPTVLTGILAPRFLIGSGVLFHEFQQRVREDLVSDPARFIAEQVAAQQERHGRFGDSLYLLQPNIKEGAGGLRDYHLAYWVMLASQPAARRREDFLQLGLLTEGELYELTAGLDFLWRVRNELHLITGRKTDQLSFELQDKIASSFGYAGSDAPGAELPVERFMSHYYRHARAVENYSSLVIEQCQQRASPARRREVRQVEAGLRIADGQLEIPHARQLREDPVQLLLAFAVAQEHDVRLTRKARRLVREQLDLVDDEFRRDPRARATFFRILESEHRVMRSLRAMNEVGLLAAFLPEWEHIVCRWQHVMYHTYTVDVHSIFLVEELRRLWLGRYRDTYPELTDLMHSVDDRAVLFLGCLLHDIGKGFGGDHSSRGVERAIPCVERLGLSEARRERVVFLVRYHLLMSHLAQRRDLSDPNLILEFARTVGDRTNLRNLYLLTFADMRASSSQAWTDWRGGLLRELFERTSELLETGADDRGKAIELVEKRVETRRLAAAAELEAGGVEAGKIRAYFDMMPRRYFTAHSPRQIARHARVVLSLERGQQMATAFREMRGEFSEFILCTRDVPGLYANVAGTLTAHGINILGAHVYSTRSGLALEVYRVSTPPGGEAERRLALESFEESLEELLRGEMDVAELLRRRGRRVARGGASPSRKPATVSITNEESDFYTIVDVAANDRLGLLHDLTRTIAEHGYEIYISKAGTVLDQVTDAFYLKDRAGKKLQDPEAIERLRTDLLAAVRLGERGDAA